MPPFGVGLGFAPSAVPGVFAPSFRSGTLYGCRVMFGGRGLSAGFAAALPSPDVAGAGAVAPTPPEPSPVVADAGCVCGVAGAGCVCGADFPEFETRNTTKATTIPASSPAAK